MPVTIERGGTKRWVAAVLARQPPFVRSRTTSILLCSSKAIPKMAATRWPENFVATLCAPCMRAQSRLSRRLASIQQKLRPDFV